MTASALAHAAADATVIVAAIVTIIAGLRFAGSIADWRP